MQTAVILLMYCQVILGVLQDNTSPPLDSYLFEEVFYDSELEKLNMTEGEVRSVIVSQDSQKFNKNSCSGRIHLLP